MNSSFPDWWPPMLGSNAGAASFARMWEVRHQLPLTFIGVWQQTPRTWLGNLRKERQACHVFRYTLPKGTVKSEKERHNVLAVCLLPAEGGEPRSILINRRDEYAGMTFSWDRFQKNWEPMHDLMQLAIGAQRNPDVRCMPRRLGTNAAALAAAQAYANKTGLGRVEFMGYARWRQGPRTAGMHGHYEHIFDLPEYNEGNEPHDELVLELHFAYNKSTVGWLTKAELLRDYEFVPDLQQIAWGLCP